MSRTNAMLVVQSRTKLHRIESDNYCCSVGLLYQLTVTLCELNLHMPAAIPLVFKL